MGRMAIWSSWLPTWRRPAAPGLGNVSGPMAIALVVPFIICLLLTWSVPSPSGQGTFFHWAGESPSIAVAFGVLVVWPMALVAYALSQQKRTLTQVAERNEFAIAGSGLGLWDWEIATDRLYWSPRFFEIIGEPQPTSRFTLADLKSRLDTEDSERLVAQVQAHIDDGTPFEGEYRFRHGRGHFIWIAAKGEAIRDSSGRAVRMAGSVADITLLKTLAAESERQLELLRLGEQTAAMGHWHLDVSTGAVTWSDGVSWIHGFEPGTFDPNLESGINFYVPEDRALVAAHVEHAIATGTGFDFKARIIRTDGAIRHVHSRGEVTLDSTGAALSVFGIFQDMTETSLAMERLKTSEERFATAVEGLSVGLWDWIDVAGDAQWWSSRFYALLGYETDEVQGSVESFRALLHTDDQYHLQAAMEEHFHKHAPFRLECRLKTKAGEYRWFLTTGFATRNVEGKPTRMIGSIMDIHDLKAANAALQAHTEQLQKANQDLDHFAYIASHDLRAPLRGIKSAATWIEEDIEDHLTDDTRQHLELLRSRTARMERLLSDILAYARAGRQTARPTLVDCRVLIDDVIEWIQPPDGFAVRILTPLPAIFFSQSILEQLFLNLIGNAIKHHDRPSGEVTISHCTGSGMHRFTISDDGPGIPQQFHEKAFTMFQTLQSRDKVEGSGIGLAIVKKMIDAVGGTITIHSPLSDRGTAFEITLPAEHCADYPVEDPRHAYPPPGLAAAG